MSQTTATFTATDFANVRSIVTEESYGRLVGTCVVESQSTTLGLSDAFSVSLGYADANTKVFQGFVKSIDRMRPEGTVTVTGHGS